MSMKFFVTAAMTLAFSSFSFAGGLNLFAESAAQVNLINSKTTSCYAQVFDPSKANDIEARYFSLGKSNLMWGSTDSEMHVTGIHFGMTAPAPIGTIQKDINGDELRALFNNADPKSDNIIPPAQSENEPSKVTLMCPIVVGDIVLTEAQDTSFSAPTVGTIEGFERNIKTGEETEVSGTFYFSVVNRGAQN